MSRALLTLAIFSIITASCSESARLTPPLCDAAQLVLALADAEPGDTVRIGTCAVEGNFVVPAGVSLTGAGRELSTISASTGTTLVVEGGPLPASIRNLTVRGLATAAVLAVRGPRISLSAVRLDVGDGAALQLDGARDFYARDLEVTGHPVARREPPTANVALALSDVDGVTLEDVVLADVDGLGIDASHATNVTLSRVSLTSPRAGVARLDGGSVTLRDVVVTPPTEDDGQRATTRALVQIAGGAHRLERFALTRGTTVHAVHADGADVTLVDFSAHDTFAPIWVQRGSLAVGGNATRITRARGAGIVALDVALSVSGAQIDGTSMLPAGALAPSFAMGDGLHVVSPRGNLTLANITLGDNARVGLVVDLPGASASELSFDNVVVSSDTALGAIVQRAGAIDTSATATVLRRGGTAERDAAATEPLPVLTPE